MPRNKMSEEEKKTHITTVRMNDFEYEMVSGRAKDAGLSISNYIRHQAVFGKVDNHFQIVADFPRLETITRELSRIGNNLNQIAHRLNCGEKATENLRRQTVETLAEVREAARELTSMAGGALPKRKG